MNAKEMKELVKWDQIVTCKRCGNKVPATKAGRGPRNIWTCEDCLNGGVKPAEKPAAQHTPGPWTATKSVLNEDGCLIGTPKILKRDGSLLTGTTMTYHDGQTFEDDVRTLNANARLIAAAPELLDALEKADKWVAMYLDLEGHKAAAESMLAVIRAAIAKAKGE